MFQPRKTSPSLGAQVVAQLLFEQFGADAARYAATRLAGQRDGERRRQWRAVLEQLSELLADMGTGGPADRACA